MSRAHALHRAALALLLAGCGGARTAARARAPSDGFALTVPFTDAGGLVIVDVQVDGVTTPQRFVVDTGAGTTVISTRLDRLLEPRRRGKVWVADAAGRAEPTPIARLDGLELGGVRFADVGAAVLDLEAVEESLCTRIDGIVGTNVFQHGVLELDYAKKEVRLASAVAGLPQRDRGETLALVDSWMPYLAIQRGHRRVGVLLVDSGSAGALSLPTQLREPLGVAEVVGGRGMVGVGAHGPVQGEKQAFPWPDATIGGHDFTGVDTIAHASDTGTLGAKVLRAYVVRIDYRARKLSLWKNGAALPKGATSFGFEWIAGPLPEVSFVWEGSAAQQAGVAVGQRITKIDGQVLGELDDLARCELARDMGAGQGGEAHAFEIGGRTIELRRAPLVGGGAQR